MKPNERKYIKALTEELIATNVANLKKAHSKGVIDTKANRRMKAGVYMLICDIGETYATLSTHQFGRICGVNNVTVLRHGGPVAIKKAWQKRDLRRILGGSRAGIKDLELRTKILYEEVAKDYRTIEIMLVLGDKYFFDGITQSFLPMIRPHDYGNFCYALYDYLESWRQDKFKQSDVHWMQLANIMNSFTRSQSVPLYYSELTPKH